MIIQIIVTLLVGWIVLKAFKDFRKKKVRALPFALWELFWIAVLLAFWNPEWIQNIALIAGVGRGADFVAYIAILTAFYGMFRLYNRIETLENNLTTLVRRIAILDRMEEEVRRRRNDEHLTPDT